MCLSELQAGLNEGQPLFPTHALCIRRSQQHRSPSAGIDFRGAFRILNISELHQRNWYLAQYIPAGKNREHLFSWLSEQHVLPWTPLILKKSAARIKSAVTVDIYTPCFPVTFS